MQHGKRDHGDLLTRTNGVNTHGVAAKVTVFVCQIGEKGAQN